jgi:hypothetical protein
MGDFKYSSINAIEDYNGFKTSLNFAKTSGKYRYPSGRYTSRDDNNDLGINFYNNFNLYSNLSYRILNPTKQFNTFRFQNEFSLAYDNTTGNYKKKAKPTIKATTKRNHYFELGLDIKPFQSYDFYEPRILDVI